MNKKIKPFCILIDSSYYNQNLFFEKNDLVYLIHNYFIINQKAWIETDENVTNSKLYEMLENAENEISTSQPNPEIIKQKLKTLSNEYERVFVFTMPEKLSNESKQINKICKKINYPNLFVYNQKSCVYLSSQIIVKNAINILKNNPSISSQDLFAKLLKIENEIILYLIPGDITRMKKSGRVSRIFEVIKKLLRLKVLIKWNGKLSFVSASKTFKKMFKKLKQKASQLDENLNYKIYIVFWSLNKYKNIIVKESSILLKKTIVNKIPPTWHIHLGNDTIGIFLIPNKYIK